MALLKLTLIMLAMAVVSLGLGQYTKGSLPPDLNTRIAKLKRSGMLMGLLDYLGHPRPPAPEDFLLAGLILAKNLELVAGSLEEDERASLKYLLTMVDYPRQLRYWDQVPEFCRTADDALDFGASGLAMEGSALEEKHSQIAVNAERIRRAVKKLDAFYQRIHQKEAQSAPAWARPAIASLLDNGLMRGYPDGTF